MCASQKGSAVTNRILRATKAAAEAVSLGSLLNDHGGDCIVRGRDVTRVHIEWVCRATKAARRVESRRIQ